MVGELYMNLTSIHGNDSLPSDFLVRTYWGQMVGMSTVIIFIWMIGLLLNELNEMRHFDKYFDRHRGASLLDLPLVGIFLLWFILRIISAHQVKAGLDYFSIQSSWDNLLNNDTEAKSKMDLINADR